MSEIRPSFQDKLTTEQKTLWLKLASFPFDADSTVKPFTARLASENGWSVQFTDRVVNEYRRFLFLTSTAGHIVCPSEGVDTVWHQHLTYSRSYWQDLCQQTLGGPLHHDPTMGGHAEQRKHWEMYRQTLDSYRRIFAEEPPRDIWPLPFDRFDPLSQMRVVNRRDHWIVRKPDWWPRGIGTNRELAFAFFPVAAIGLGPFDWTGPTFLAFFFCLYGIVLVGSLVYRRRVCDAPITDDRDLTPDEISCLSFGPASIVNGTVARMLHSNQLISATCKGWFGTTNGAKVTFGVGEQIPRSDDPLATAIYQNVAKECKTLNDLQQAMSEKTKAIDERLKSEGYLLDDQSSWMARSRPALAMLLLFGFGFIKIAIGVNRGRPVEFLVMGCFLLFFTGAAMLAPIRYSLTTHRLLRSLKSQHADLKSAMRSSFSSNEVALCAALFGASALQGSSFEDLKAAWRSTAQNGASGGGGCGGGGCGGGCGGGGCGGCGG